MSALMTHKAAPRPGDILFTLDPRPFVIAVDNAKAAPASTAQGVESTGAQYQSAVAQVAAQLAQVNVNQQTHNRYVALPKQNAIVANDVLDV